MAKILIVDDEPSAREVLHDMLLPEGHTVAQAASAFEAIDLARTFRPDVIVTDVMMPGMDGFELCRHLRDEEATHSTPIIVVTALGSREDMARALDVGATDFIAKPVNGIEVRARIRSMVRVGREHKTLLQMIELRNVLANMIIHDLRNPLQVISFSTEVLSRMLPDSPAALNRIRTQTVRLQGMIDDLLVVARSEAGVLVARPVEVEAQTLVDLVVEDCRPTAQAAGVALLVDVTSDRPLSVDALLMRRCLENLVLNAIKFSPSGTIVTVVLIQSSGGIRIDVLDEGPGIPEALRESIFERFATVEREDVRVSQTGLGLAFCRMAVQAHGGTIAVLPREPAGSIFRVSLPSITPPAG
ncbi:MAG TPA: hybrid sensor histidine kinase/response regulator [Thermoanaerobaculia bacterium]|jgi:signal transduction histidine kinase|nr:hybrid sensor histidine kinase/response regulator [Thermoanaerobaculia bacterium]